MKLIVIAAVSLDGVIGVGDQIPWRIPEDFKHFRNTTMGNTLLVGKTTYLTLPPKAHEGRKYVVLSRGETISELYPDDTQFNDLDTALQSLRESDKVYVIGGANVYGQLLDYCDEAVITWVDKLIPEGDKWFPLMKLLKEFQCYDSTNWQTSKTGEQYKIRYYKKQNGN